MPKETKQANVNNMVADPHYQRREIYKGEGGAWRRRDGGGHDGDVMVIEGNRGMGEE